MDFVLRILLVASFVQFAAAQTPDNSTSTAPAAPATTPAAPPATAPTNAPAPSAVTPPKTQAPTTPTPMPSVTSPTPTAPVKSTTAAPATAAPPQAPAGSPNVAQVRRRLKQILAIFEITISGQPAGVMKARLFIDKAPKTVENFMGLVEGSKEFTEFDAKKGTIGKPVKRPFYDGLSFHRVSPGYIIQGGCPFGTGRGGPGFTISDEISTELRHDSAGVLSMARTEKKDSAGSQFFITLAPLKHLDGKYTIFGRLVEGQEILKKISSIKVDPINDKPFESVVMKSVRIQKEYFP